MVASSSFQLMISRRLIRFQTVFTPGAFGPPAEMIGSPETIRMAFKPLKASDQLNQVAEVFPHASPLRLWLLIQ
jgi:hypothetical protein